MPKYVPRKTCFHMLVCFRLMLAYLGYTFGITVEIYHVRTLLKLGGSSETGFLSDLAPLQPAERQGSLTVHFQLSRQFTQSSRLPTD